MDNYDELIDIPEKQRLLNDCLMKRQHAYSEELGNWQQQLDLIFHDFEAWRTAVQEIKNKYPKPQ